MNGDDELDWHALALARHKPVRLMANAMDAAIAAVMARPDALTALSKLQSDLFCMMIAKCLAAAATHGEERAGPDGSWTKSLRKELGRAKAISVSLEGELHDQNVACRAKDKEIETCKAALVKSRDDVVALEAKVTEGAAVMAKLDDKIRDLEAELKADRRHRARIAAQPLEDLDGPGPLLG